MLRTLAGRLSNNAPLTFCRLACSYLQPAAEKVGGRAAINIAGYFAGVHVDSVSLPDATSDRPLLRFYLKDRVEPRVSKYVMYVIVNIYYFQPRTVGNEALLRFQQYTEPGTGDVFQLGKIERAGPLD